MLTRLCTDLNTQIRQQPTSQGETFEMKLGFNNKFIRSFRMHLIALKHLYCVMWIEFIFIYFIYILRKKDKSDQSKVK